MYKEFLVVIDSKFLSEIELICQSLSLSYKVIPFYGYYLFFIHENDYLTFFKNLNEFLNETITFKEEKVKISIPVLNDKIGFLSYFLISGMILFYFFYTFTDKKYFFIEAGANDAFKVLNGEFYRCVTALFLHANLIHLLSNIIFFSIIFRYVIKIFGEGLGWLLIIFSGACGNFVTSFIYGNFHSSIGFSTSVFATIGILSNVNLKIVKNYVPLIGGFFLLIMLGGGNKKIDVLSHITGLGSGFLLTELVLRKYKNLISYKYQFIFKNILILMIFICWILAIRYSH